MSKSIAVPEELYLRAAEIAAKENMPVDEFVSTAIADRLATRRYLEARANRASNDRLREALAQIPDVEPEEYDRL
jgi:hypothetical protein